MVNDTLARPKGKDKMDENNTRRTLSNRKETSSAGKDGLSSWRRLDRESSFHAHCRPIAQSPLKLKRLENDKKKKERNGLQLSMESKNVEVQSEMDRKRKIMTAHSYKAQYKAQPVKMVVSDTDEATEGPNAVLTDKFVAGPPGSVDSENSFFLPRLRVVTVHSHSETVEECRDPKATKTILFPESVSDSRHVICKSVCSKRKRINSDSNENDLCSCGGAVNKNLGRLLCSCKKRAQYSNESLCEPNTDNGDVGNKRRNVVNENVDPASVNREPLDERGAESVTSKLPNVRKEIGVKSPSEENCGSKHDKKYSDIEKKCRTRRKKLQHKQQENIQAFHKIWGEKRDQIDKDLQLETAFTRFVFSEVSGRAKRLKRLNETFAMKVKNHNLLKNVELKNLEVEQLAAMNEEKKKAERWLTAAKTCYDEPMAVNVPPLIDDNAEVSQLAINTNVDATRVVFESTDQVSDKNASESESTRHFQDQDPNEDKSPRCMNLEDQIPSENESTQLLQDQNLSEIVCAKANAFALANTSISARVDPVHCDIPTKLKILVTSDFQNKVVQKDMDGSSVDMVEQSNQIKPLCDNSELVCVAALPIFEDQSVNLTVLTIESSVEVPAKAPNENESQDEIHSSFAEQINKNELAVHNQRDSQVGDPELVDTAVHFNVELEEGEIKEVELEGEIQGVELEEGEIQEKTMGKQGTVNSETVAIVEPGEEEPIMEKQRIVNSETVANVEPGLITEKPDGNVLVLGNQHTSEIQFEKLRHVNDSLTDGKANVELQVLVTRAVEIDSNSEVANSDLVYTVDPAQPIREQLRSDSPTIGNQNTCVIRDPFSSHTAGVVEAEILSHEPVSQIEPVQPIKEQPPAEDVESQNTCHIEAPISIQTADMTEFETLSFEPPSQIISQIDTVQPIVEQSLADAETVKCQNASHIEALLSKIADLAEAETLPLEPASQICLVENQNASLIEAPLLSQMENVAETQIEHIHSIIKQPQADEETAENQNSLIEVPFSSQIAEVVDIEALLHEPSSQSVENLETRSISSEQIVEFTTSQSNEPICEGVIGEAELSIEGVPHNEISASYLYGSGHLLPSLNTHPFDPIECELGKAIKEKEEFERSHLNMTVQLKSNCEKEIEEMLNQIKQKYGMQLQVAEAEFRQRRSEFKNYLNKLQMNKKLTEAFRNKFTDPGLIGHPVNQQGTSESVYMQHMHHLSVHPSLRVIANASSFQPSPSHSSTSFVGPPIMPHQSLAPPTRFSQITSHSVSAPPVHSRSHPNAGSVRPYIMPHHSLACPTRFSSITRHSVTAPPALPVHPVQHMQAFFSTPPRPPPVIRSVMPSYNPHAPGEISSVAPHHRSFRPVGLTTSSPISLDQLTFQNGPGPQDGLLAETTPHLSTMTSWEVGPWSRVRANSSSGFSEIRQNYTSFGLGVQGSNTLPGNDSSSMMPDDVVCLSDDD